MARHPIADGALRALSLAPGIIPLALLFGAHRTRASRGTPLAPRSAERLARSGPAIVHELAFCGRQGATTTMEPST